LLVFCTFLSYSFIFVYFCLPYGQQLKKGYRFIMSETINQLIKQVVNCVLYTGIWILLSVLYCFIRNCPFNSFARELGLVKPSKPRHHHHHHHHHRHSHSTSSSGETDESISKTHFAPDYFKNIDQKIMGEESASEGYGKESDGTSSEKSDSHRSHHSHSSNNEAHVSHRSSHSSSHRKSKRNKSKDNKGSIITRSNNFREKHCVLDSIIRVIFLLAFTAFVYYLIKHFCGGLSNRTLSEEKDTMPLWLLVVSVILAGIRSGFGEELFFRGVIAKFFYKKENNPAIANVNQAVIYMILSLIPFFMSPSLELFLLSLNSFVLGLTMGRIMYNAGKSIIPSIIIHSTVSAALIPVGWYFM